MVTAGMLGSILSRQPEDVSIWLPHLAETFSRFAINSPVRIAAFLAQVAHESAGFKVLQENLNYSATALLGVFPSHFNVDEAEIYARQPEKIANRVYAGRLGNGDEASGDGWKYRGRGLIQITGHANYLVCGPALGLDLLKEPDLLLQPYYAALSAGWFWSRSGLNDIADKGDFELLTKKINGGLTGLADRRKYLEKAQAALGIES